VVRVLKFQSLLLKLRRMMKLIKKKVIQAKKAMMAAVAVTMMMMMELKLVLNTMMLPRRLISPAEMLEYLFLMLL
jgi:hypothetical protein